MNLIQITTAHLRVNGYDGLYNSLQECACTVDDGLMPCDFPHLQECLPGVNRVCECETGEYHDICLGPRNER